MKGWVYIITNPAMPGIIKIGFSMKDPELRARELNSTGCPQEYSVDYCILVEEPRELEQRVHKHLRHIGVGKEWFRCSCQEATVAIKSECCGEIFAEDFKALDRQEIERDRRAREIARQAREKAEQEKQALFKKESQKIEDRFADPISKAESSSFRWPIFFFSIFASLAFLFLFSYPNTPSMDLIIFFGISGIVVWLGILGAFGVQEKELYTELCNQRDKELEKLRKNISGSDTKRDASPAPIMTQRVLNCPRCARGLRVPAEKVLNIHCPACGHRFQAST